MMVRFTLRDARKIIRRSTMSVARSLGFYPLRVANPRFTRKRTIHFLHLGKNAGTQMTHISGQLEKQNEPVRFIAHGHDVKLRHLPSGSEYVFSIRNPVTRFKSGFYNRKNKGAPGKYVEWSKDEEVCFSRFPHANNLAEALIDGHPQYAEAAQAVDTIRHLSQHQVSWFEMSGYFLETRPPIFILRQEHFEHDIKHLWSKLGIKNLPIFETAIERTRRTDYSDYPPLTDAAKSNVARWYERDFAFYARCERWIKQQC